MTTPEPKPTLPPAKRPRSKGRRLVASLFLVIGLAALVSRLDLRPDLGHIDVAVLSGAKQGHYHEIVDALTESAARKRGRIANVSTAGSVENIEKLSTGCAHRFALVQAGL